MNIPVPGIRVARSEPEFAGPPGRVRYLEPAAGSPFRIGGRMPMANGKLLKARIAL